MPEYQDHLTDEQIHDYCVYNDVPWGADVHFNTCKNCTEKLQRFQHVWNFVKDPKNFSVVINLIFEKLNGA